MKTLTSLLTATLLSSSLLLAGNGYQNGKTQINAAQQIVTDMSVYALSYEQQSAMEFMYQEEKMARDVYITLYAIYATEIFNNIAQSEQKHMDAIKVLLDKYSLSVAIDENEVGTFIDPKLQALYETLIEQGALSLEAALQVGQLIEMTDIEDLENAIAEANVDAKIVYENLMLGSENHLAAFTRLLEPKKRGERNTF